MYKYTRATALEAIHEEIAKTRRHFERAERLRREHKITEETFQMRRSRLHGQRMALDQALHIMCNTGE
jgi:hypothetical protein